MAKWVFIFLYIYFCCIIYVRGVFRSLSVLYIVFDFYYISGTVEITVVCWLSLVAVRVGSRHENLASRQPHSPYPFIYIMFDFYYISGTVEITVVCWLSLVAVRVGSRHKNLASGQPPSPYPYTTTNCLPYLSPLLDWYTELHWLFLISFAFTYWTFLFQLHFSTFVLRMLF